MKSGELPTLSGASTAMQVQVDLATLLRALLIALADAPAFRPAIAVQHGSNQRVETRARTPATKLFRRLRGAKRTLVSRLPERARFMSTRPKR